MIIIRLQILLQISFFTMDKLTKNYIDDFVRPLIYRIQSLQRSNEELKVQVKYLESIVLDKTYQKPTVSAANHMRESRISSKNESSVDKKPTWNSKTKVQQSPTNKQPIAHEKLKTKPPIPKSIRSPNKNEGEDLRSSSFQKRILGGTKLQTQASQKKQQQDDQQISPKKIDNQNKKPNQQQFLSPSTPSQKKQKSPQLDVLNNKFTQLVKNNNEILSSMKQNNQEARESIMVQKGNSPNNYVQKAMAPKSQQHSQTASPNERSFISQSHLQKPAANLKINLDGNMVQVDIK